MKAFLVWFFPLALFSLSYDVQFVGVEDPRLLRSLQDASDLVSLQNRPPASLNGLRYRVRGDVPTLIEVLHAYGYYDAQIRSDILLEEEEAKVTLSIDLGKVYSLHSYRIFHGDCSQILDVACCTFLEPEQLHLHLGNPARSIDIVQAELNVLSELSRCGYPLASIAKRKVVVDMLEKQVDATVCVEEGPLSSFGPSSLVGLKSVAPRFVLRRLAWKEGEIYDSDQVIETQKKLLNSDLFSSVLISHADTVDEEGKLPIKLRLSESKHKQITLGAFYATVDGPGATFRWTNRNARGMGETIHLDGEISARYLAGTLSYKKPDFLALDQTYRALAQIERQDIYAYHAFSYKGANFLEKRVDEERNVAVGLEVEHIQVTHSANNGDYLLFDVPMLVRYFHADDPLNPTRGYTLVYQPHFFQSLENKKITFFKQRLTTTIYFPIWKKWIVLAGRFQFGSIVGARREEIALPLLFLGGSEDDLRGYRYFTVSPLNEDNKPYGGRSAIFVTLESRFRFGEKIGIVPFADFGTVSFREFPNANEKWYKSLGVGFRYFAFFGPLRFDIGFPLDRRKSIDSWCRIYASIGQTF